MQEKADPSVGWTIFLSEGGLLYNQQTILVKQDRHPIMSSSALLSFAAEQVRRLDRDRFGTVLFAPAAKREALFALYAFNSEVAQIRELVREPLLGRIRLQWWRDSLEELREGKAVAHPVADALGAIFAAHSLPKEPFERLFSAREQDLEGVPPEDLPALEAYAEGVSGSINILALEILSCTLPGGRPGPDEIRWHGRPARGTGNTGGTPVPPEGGLFLPREPEQEAVAAVRAAGIAWALTGLLRAVPFHAAAGRVYLPAKLLADQGLTSDDLLSGRKAPALAEVAKIVAARAGERLEEARRHYRRCSSPSALPVLLCVPLAEGYLRALAKNRFNLLDRRWSTPRPRPIRLGWTMLSGRL